MTSLSEALSRRRAMESGTIWASDIYQSRLWLGAGRDAMNLSQLQQHSITHILNCADDVPNYYEDNNIFVYKSLYVADFGGDIGIKRVFREAADFVILAIHERDDTRVLIHCANGSNRSATVAIAVLMIMNGKIE